MLFASLLKSNFPVVFRCSFKLIELKLQTAVSPTSDFSPCLYLEGFVWRNISVHRFELCTTPSWELEYLMFALSLKVIQGCPVSNRDLSIFFDSTNAATCTMNLKSSRSYYFVCIPRKIKCLVLMLNRQEFNVMPLYR